MLEPFKNEIILLYQNGISTNKIGNQYKCNAGTVYYWLQQWGITVRKLRDDNDNLSNHHDEIVDMLNDGFSAYKIGKKIGFQKPSVLKYIKKHGWSTSSKSKQRVDKLLNHAEEIVNLYKDGLSTCKIAKKFKSGQSSIWRLLEKEGIKLRPKNIYDVDLTYFDKINTEDRAYFLGLMYSDGNVRKDRIRISLQEEDKEILYKMKEHIKYTGDLTKKEPPKKHPNRKVQYELCISRGEIVKQLIKLGCPPKKSLILRHPSLEQVPNHLLSSFYLGYFDGDGSISQKTQNSWQISIVSTIPFLQSLINNIGLNDYSLYDRFPQRKTITRNLMFWKKDEITKFLDYIYKDATIFLKRKHDLYLEYKNANKMSGV